MLHALKCWPRYFNDIASGKKTFEIRLNDRNFKLGDHLVLLEYDPGGIVDDDQNTSKPVFSGNTLVAEVVYIVVGGQFGLAEGYVVMGIKVSSFTTSFGVKKPATKVLLDSQLAEIKGRWDLANPVCCHGRHIFDVVNGDSSMIDKHMVEHGEQDVAALIAEIERLRNERV